MKQLLLSGFVLITFLVYSVYQRSQDSVAIPSNLSNNPIPLASPSTFPIPSPIATPLPTSVSANSSLPPTPTPTLVPTPRTVPTATPKPASGYKDGTYTGVAADAFYGNIQISATIANGRITNIQFLQYPNDRSTSIGINSQADPILAQEAIQVQSAQVDIVSGATDSSQAFIQSLQSAINQAKG